MTLTARFFLAFHLFGVILWLGSLLVIARWLAIVPNEVGVAKERFIVAAKRMFELGCNLGAAAGVAFGIAMIMLDPPVLYRGWFHAKMLLVIVLIVYHIRFYRRIIYLEDNPSAATAREFRTIYAAVSALMLGILVLTTVQPF
jgi:protoporphyrinogen IX oxidase